MLGRLASVVAKQILSGFHVVSVCGGKGVCLCLWEGRECLCVLQQPAHTHTHDARTPSIQHGGQTRRVREWGESSREERERELAGGGGARREQGSNRDTRSCSRRQQEAPASAFVARSGLLQREREGVGLWACKHIQTACTSLLILSVLSAAQTHSQPAPHMTAMLCCSNQWGGWLHTHTHTHAHTQTHAAHPRPRAHTRTHARMDALVHTYTHAQQHGGNVHWVWVHAHILASRMLAPTLTHTLLSSLPSLPPQVVCRAEQLTLSGGLVRQKMKYERFLRKRMLTNPQHGPIHFRAPSRIFWRTVRG